jgi:poly(A) polymerase
MIKTKEALLTSEQHPISPQSISKHALKILHRLNDAGFHAYLVGGCIRDLLVDIAPKDFDLVTDATPEEIKRLFRNCRLIGRRFRLAHIHFGRDIIEVATFRAPPTEDSAHKKCEKSGFILRDNVFGSIEEDAFRRDFTINALYYNIEDASIRDFTGGLKDIAKKSVRIIGDPETRYREDPVRMLRAIRHAAKLGFTLDKKTAKPIKKFAPLLNDISSSRLFEEYIKLFHGGQAKATFLLLQQYQLFDKLFPKTQIYLTEFPSLEKFFTHVLQNTDERIQAGKTTTPAFILATFLWHPWLDEIENFPDDSLSEARHAAFETTFREQGKFTSSPKHFTNTVKDIWLLQFRLVNILDKRCHHTLSHPRFRAGYDFLLMRANTCDPELMPYAQWWTDFQTATPAEQETLLKFAEKELNPIF